MIHTSSSEGRGVLWANTGARCEAELASHRARRRASATELRQGRINKAELKEIEHGSEFLTSGRRSRRLGKLLTGWTAGTADAELWLARAARTECERG
jgi:hypothetical protein